jgi:hypothetical protein
MFAEAAIIITIYPLLTKENKLSFFVFHFHLQETNRSLLFSVCSIQLEVAFFPLVSLLFSRNPGNMETWRQGEMGMEKMEMEAMTIFLNPLIVFSL